MKFERFLELVSELQKILDSGASEDTKYDIISSTYYYRELENTGVPVNYGALDHVLKGMSGWKLEYCNMLVQILQERAKEIKKIVMSLEN